MRRRKNNTQIINNEIAKIIDNSAQNNNGLNAKIVSNINNPAIIVVGIRGTGKTFYVKSKLNRITHNKLIYDVKLEYTGIKPPPMDVFKEQAKNARDTAVVFEESSSFFPAQRDIKTVEYITGLRHANNACFFVFHSLNLVPPYFLELCDFIVIKHTKDDEGKMREKFSNEPEILAAYLRLKSVRDNGITTDEEKWQTEEVKLNTITM